MKKEFNAEINLRGLNKMTKAEARLRLGWLRKKIAILDRQVKGPWLVTRKDYAPLFSFRLMK